MNSEEMNTQDQTTQAENMGDEADVQGEAVNPNGEQKKTFTQEEVNSFVKSQVARMMKKATREQETEYSQKMQELQAKESKLMVKEALSDRGMPRELADIITCADENDLKAKLDAIQKIYGDKAKEEEPVSGFRPLRKGFMSVGAPPSNYHDCSPSNPVRRAMGLE